MGRIKKLFVLPSRHAFWWNGRGFIEDYFIGDWEVVNWMINHRKAKVIKVWGEPVIVLNPTIYKKVRREVFHGG